MADKSYSIDDILSEYPKVGDDGEAKGEHVNIDELLLDFDKDSSSDTAENAAGSTDNTDGSDYAAEPELSGNADNESLEKGSFEKKYEKLNGQMTAIKERAESEQADYTPPPKQERSFSEKWSRATFTATGKRKKNTDFSESVTRLRRKSLKEQVLPHIMMKKNLKSLSRKSRQRAVLLTNTAK